MELELHQIFDSIIVSGDVHGDIIPLVNKINERYKICNSLIIVAGDSGIGFYKDGFYTNLFKKANSRLKRNNNTLLLIRGNHDNPQCFSDHLPFKSYWQDSKSNIRIIKDYTVISVHSERNYHRILCVGGATSVDRTQRNENYDYWTDEPFVYDESKAETLVGITEVITHSAPSFCAPLIKGGLANWILKDKKLEEDCDKERNDHTLLYNKLKEKNQIKKWFYGHFHFSNKMEFEGTMFRLCDIMELIEI